MARAQLLASYCDCQASVAIYFWYYSRVPERHWQALHTYDYIRLYMLTKLAQMSYFSIQSINIDIWKTWNKIKYTNELLNVVIGGILLHDGIIIINKSPGFLCHLSLCHRSWSTWSCASHISTIVWISSCWSLNDSACADHQLFRYTIFLTVNF